MTKSLAPFGIVFALLIDVAHSQDNGGGAAVSYCRDRIRSMQLQELVSQRSSPGAYIHLSNDQTILCFDGRIHRNQEMTLFRNLKVNGSFVMRSPGGYAEAAMEMANILLEKNAVVVLHDYCLSACANYIFIASGQTNVARDAIVAWHGGPWASDCDFPDQIRVFSDRQPALATDQKEKLCKVTELQRDFFRMRGTDGAIVHAPQSHHTRKMLKLSAQLSGYRDRNVFWMWNPKHYRDRFKTRIVYETYPGSQEEVDEIMKRFHWSYVRVIYDP